MALNSYGIHSYGLNSYDLISYGSNSHGPKQLWPRPKFVSADLPIFEWITSDLFDVKLQPPSYDHLFAQVGP